MYKQNYSGPGISAQVKNGQFALSLPDGDYILNQFTDQQSRVRSFAQKISVRGGVLQNGSTVAIMLHRSNVSGTIKDADGNVITQGDIYFFKTNSDVSYHTEVLNGQFSLYLPDGEYMSGGLWDRNVQKTISIPDSRFTVTGSATVSYQLRRNNVSGTIVDETGKQITSGSINFYQLNAPNGAQGFNGNLEINSEGTFETYMPDGTYRMDTLRNMQDETALFMTFTVSGNTIVDIVVHQPNVTGTLTKEGVPLNDVYLQFYRLNANESGYSVKVKNGAFQFYLPTDGEYQVFGLSDNSTRATIPVLARFTLQNGHLTGPLDIVEKLPNVQGTIKLYDGTLLENAQLSFFKPNSTEPGYSVTVNHGAFSLYLTDGTYQLGSYYTNGEQTQLTGTFTVSGGQLTAALSITVPNKNVNGTLKTAAGINLDQVILQLHPQNGGQGFSAQVVNGTFSLALSDGTYVIEGYMDPVTRVMKPIAGTFTVALTE